ncbi:MAG TPA: hypothetical protein VFM54_07060 [Micromonosporaceae bacterium]|nr:hypothetical protein [Micromonosporaceae bacterium]
MPGQSADDPEPAPARGADPSSWSATGAALDPPTDPVAHTWRETAYRGAANRHPYADLLSPVAPAPAGPRPSSSERRYERDVDELHHVAPADRAAVGVPVDRPVQPSVMPVEPPPLPPDFDPWSHTRPLTHPQECPEEATARLSGGALSDSLAPAPTQAPGGGGSPPRYPVPPLPPQHVPPPGREQEYDSRLTPPYGVPMPSRPINGSSHYADRWRPAEGRHGEVYPEVYPAEAYAEPDPVAAEDGELDESLVDDEPVEDDSLPQRVPGEPDVPTVPGPVAEEADESAQVRDIARIADHLRHNEAAGRPLLRESMDTEAVLAAVRGVPGVRDAQLRPNPGGVHSLRLDLVEGADAAQISREVARLLKERLGLAAAVGAPGTATAPGAAGAPGAPGVAGAAAGAHPTSGAPAAFGGTGFSGAGAGGVGAFAGPAAPLGGPEGLVPGPDRGGRRAGDGGRRTEPDPAYAGRRRVHPGAVRGRASVEPRAAELPGLTVLDRVSRPLPRPEEAVRVVLDQVLVSTFGMDAKVEVRIGAGERRAVGEAEGPAVDQYVLRLAAVAAAAAMDRLLVEEGTGVNRGRCFVEHVAVVPFGNCEVAVVVLLLVCPGWVDQLSGSAVVAGDPRQAVVRATLAAVNRRVEALLP